MFNKIKNNLLQTQLFIDNDFLDKYLYLIILNLDTKKELHKTQKHHIIPRKAFKIKGENVDNSKKNLVNLLYKDHILVHYYLCKCTTGDLRNANVKAVVSMVNKSFKDINEQWILDNLHDFQKLYEENSKQHSNFFKQIKHPVGWHHSDGVKLKISQSNMGKTMSDASKQKMRLHHYDCTGENNPAKGRHWYNNGTDRLYLKDGDVIPEGFTLGALPKTDAERQKRSASLKGKKSKAKGSHWYNNGVISIMSTDCPDGFVSGRLKMNNVHKHTGTSGRIWVNNGEIEIYINQNDNIPEGFSKGRKKKKIKENYK